MPELSESQAEFANGSLSAMVVACPGAGKTRAIVARYVNRAAATTRKGIALLSFTNAAVDEVGRRCSSRHELLAHPHFVGTFDSFIQRLIYGPWFASSNLKTPRFIESWDVQDITKVIPDARRPFEFFSLESFDFDENGAAVLVPDRIPSTYRQSMTGIYQARKFVCDTKAAQLRAGRLERGFVACSEARRQTLLWLRDANRRATIATTLASRFSEVIVDEAQDCGPEELELLKALRDVGVVTSVVGDPDQAIYEFRNAVPELVVEFGQNLECQITFADNYRSSPAICKTNSVLRVAGTPDVSNGDFSTCETPIHVLPYAAFSDITPAFREILTREQGAVAEAIIISHSGKDARKAALAVDESAGGNKFCFIAAKAGMVLREKTASPLLRRRALDRFLRRLLELYANTSTDSFDDAAATLGTSVAELKSVAVRLVLSLDARTMTREEYAPALRQKIEALHWPAVPTIGNISQVVKVCPEADWQKLGLEEAEVCLSSGTIHSAKGLEYESVCLVIPKIRATAEKSGLQAWIDGDSSESRRVLYVGASRAKKLLVIAVHQDDHATVRNKLSDLGIPLAD